VHGTSVVITVLAVLVLAWRLRRRPTERTEVAEWVSAWIVIALLQGAIGYVQYFNEVPALLVGVHVFGATVLWATTVALVLRTLPARRPAPVDAAVQLHSATAAATS
ncbi:MAG: hypothetical protein K0S92_1606, partial [Desertimonas sp.]|nr:hypothetical protein [Desertimonas sp.]